MFNKLKSKLKITKDTISDPRTAIGLESDEKLYESFGKIYDKVQKGEDISHDDVASALFNKPYADCNFIQIKAVQINRKKILKKWGSIEK